MYIQNAPKKIISALISGFIGLAFEGISSYLQYKQQRALQQAMHTVNKRINIEQNRVFHLEDSMIMYGIYNVDTLEKLIQMVHKMNNRSVWYEKLYAGHVNKWFEMYLASQGANYYAIHSLLYLRTIQEKYIKMYERFVICYKNIIKRIFTYISITSVKISKNITRGERSFVEN